MLKEFFGLLFSSKASLTDRFFSAVAWVVVGLIGVLGFIALNSVGISSEKTTTAVIEEKVVVPPYTYTLRVGKVLVPEFVEENYKFHLKIDNKTVSPVVDKKFFDSVNVGDKIQVSYGFGRLNGSYEVTSVRLVGK